MTTQAVQPGQSSIIADLSAKQKAAIQASKAPETDGSKDAKTIANNFDQFLTLLTTQLRNQNPLDPLDTNQFTQQLVQFSSVEQQLKTNDTLNQLVTAVKAGGANKLTPATAASLLGTRVTVDGSVAAGGKAGAVWQLEMPAAATAAKITVKDDTGKAVWTETRGLNSGVQNYNWRGQTDNGLEAKAGNYTIEIAAKDAAGRDIRPIMGSSGVVDEVDLSNGKEAVKIGGRYVPIDQISKVSRGQ